MDNKERKAFQKEFEDVQQEMKGMIKQINRNPALLKDESFIEKRTRLFYKSYCIDCTLRGEWCVSYEKYKRGE